MSTFQALSRRQSLFAWLEWRMRQITPWTQRAKLVVTRPLHYPGKLLSAVTTNR